MLIAKMPDGSCEIYNGVQGEGLTQGLPIIFIRQSMCNLACNFCFVKGTKITMEDGTKKDIELIERGDRVLAYNEEEKDYVIDEVTKIYQREIGEGENLFKVEMVDGRELNVTGEHPFMTQRGWVKASELTEQDSILSTNKIDFSL